MAGRRQWEKAWRPKRKVAVARDGGVACSKRVAASALSDIPMVVLDSSTV